MDLLIRIFFLYALKIEMSDFISKYWIALSGLDKCIIIEFRNGKSQNRYKRIFNE